MRFTDPRRRPRWALLPAILLPAGAAAASGQLLTINWSIDGGPVNELDVSASGSSGATLFYEGQSVDPATGLVLDYSFAADPSSTLAGTIAVANTRDATVAVSAEVMLPFDADFPSGSDLRGSGIIGLATGPGGGAVSSVPGQWVWRTVTDGAPAGDSASLFADPFKLTASGIGSAAVFDHFGVPVPIDGPPVGQSIGLAFAFQLTQGDEASVGGEIVVSGCPNDLTGDDMTGILDMYALTAAWGPCPGGTACPADFDDDGIVGITDLLELLSNWGACD